MNKENIKAIIENEYRVPAGSDLDDLTSQLIDNLGSTDAYLRENSLEILWQWGQNGTFSDDQLINIGQTMAANLAVGLGESGTDTVFLRAFSVLVLAAVIIVDQRSELGQIEGRSSFLSQEMLLEWFALTVSCFEGEQDRRGCVGKAGWAHSIAHCGDALSDFARSDHLSSAHLERILGAIATKMSESCDEVLQIDEDNRLAQTVVAVLRRNVVSSAFLHQWLKDLSHRPDGGHWGDVYGLEAYDERANYARLNTRGFLRSLYFQLHIGSRSFRAQRFPEYYARPIPHCDELMLAIIDALKAMDKWFYPKEE